MNMTRVKTFLSIGTGPGIGAATAERFAREGFRVVVTAREATSLAERVATFEGKGHRVAGKVVDAGDIHSVSSAIRAVEAEFGPIDVLHFNAAAMHDGTLEAQDQSTFVPDLIVNIGAGLVAMQEVSRSMLTRGDGTILLTGGIFSTAPNPDYLSLGLGKAALLNVNQAIFDRFRERGVHVATVTVATLVGPGSAEARGVADAFWALHSESKDAWSLEVRYPTV